TTPSPWEHPPAVPDNTDEDATDDEPEDHAETA
ncbi:MAG: hypothetical protein JWM22_1012, partial [Frankiales bacterium]|nr:hypothetical protein [Frankiales bacterium]